MIDITALKEDMLTVKSSRKEVRILEVALQAGKNVDLSIRHAFYDETEKLHRLMKSVSDDMRGKTVAFSFSQRLFLNRSSIFGAVNTMEPEIVFPDMAG